MSVERVPLRVPHSRRSIRLRGFDYSRTGVYFVTICAQKGTSVFGSVVGGKVRLNAGGRTAVNCWLEIATHFPNVTLDEFIVMPNHLHGILAINGIRSAIGVGAQHAAPLPLTRHTSVGHHASRGPARAGVAPGSLGAIVRSFKSATTKRINEIRQTPGEAVWQRNDYDRIIRNDGELERARGYVRLNPVRWIAGGGS